MKIISSMIVFVFLAVSLSFGPVAGQTNRQSVPQKRLLGAGGSFQSPLYQDWANTFNILSPDVTIEYEGVTQADGRARLLAASVDFAGSDYNIFSTADYATRPTYRLFPTFGGNVGFSYNLREFARTDPRLCLDRSIVSRIFRGNITRWNDPDLVALQKRVYPSQPDVIVNGTAYNFWEYKMPNRPIRLGLRADRALVTTILGTGLVAADPWWSQQFNDSIQRNSAWPASILANRTAVSANLGMLGHLTTVADSMGYHPFPYLVQFPEIRHFVMVNIHGNVADPTDMEQLEAVMAHYTNESLSVDEYRIVLPEIVDPPLPNSWPYSTFNYIVVDTNSSIGNCANRTAFWKWINWALTSASAKDVGRRKGYAQIPRVLADVVLNRIRQNFTCLDHATGVTSHVLVDTPYPQRDAGTVTAFVLEMICIGITLLGLAIYVFYVYNTSDTAPLEYFFTGVFAVGTLLIGVSIITWFLIPTNSAICHARVWLAALGMTVVLSSMFTRQYHLYKIYGHYKRSRLLSMDTMIRKLIMLSATVVSIMVTVQFIILILWQSLHPLSSQLSYRDEINLVTSYECRGSNVLIWLLIELIFVFAMLGFGVYVIYLAWDLRGNASETRGLFIATYNVILLACVLTPLAVVLPFDDVRVFYTVSITLTFAVASTGAALYWRKLVSAKKTYSSRSKSSTVSSKAKSAEGTNTRNEKL